MEDIRIYVACLASYVGGHLHGEWIDLNPGVEVDEIHEAIAEILKSSPIHNAEEWAVHDYELPSGLRLSEYPDLEMVALLANALYTYDEPFAVVLNDGGGVDDFYSVLDTFENGSWRVLGSKHELAEDILEMAWDSVGAFTRYGSSPIEWGDLPGVIQNNIDMDAVYDYEASYRDLYEMSDGSILEFYG